MFYAISYDIRDDRRRSSTGKILEKYGARIQRSVFECALTSNQFRELLQKLEAFVDAEQDSLRFYPLCNACSGNITQLGGIPIARDPAYYIA